MTAAIRVIKPGWTVEGVLLCPECLHYLDFCGTPQELQEFIARHDCTVAKTGKDFQ